MRRRLTRWTASTWRRRRRIEATAGGAGVGGSVDEVRGGAGGDSFGDAGAVAVVKGDGSAGLGEADYLLGDGLFEAVALGLRARVAASFAERSWMALGSSCGTVFMAAR